MSPEARHNLFLVIKETLNNIVRHAGAGEVWLRVRVDGDSLHVEIEDDGHGFARLPAGGNADGLQNIRQRMAEIGGESRVESRPETGTRVSLIFHRQNGK
jgi:signal transduction histidine kinase